MMRIKHLALALLVALFLFLIQIVPVFAATCFWVGGSGTFSLTNTTNWASSSNGSGGTCAATGNVPKNAGDIAIFDSNSGVAAVISMSATLNGISVQTFSSSAGTGSFAGTWDFTVGNPNITFTNQFDFGGSGARTLKCGTSTFTLTGSGNNTVVMSGTPTITCGSETWAMSPANNNSQVWFMAAASSYGTLQMTGRANGSQMAFANNQANTFANLTILAPVILDFGASLVTLSNAPNINLTSTTSALIRSTNNSQVGITLSAGGTFNWVSFNNVNFTGTAPTITNGINFGNVTGATVNPPGGGGNRIIGG